MTTPLTRGRFTRDAAQPVTDGLRWLCSWVVPDSLPPIGENEIEFSVADALSYGEDQPARSDTKTVGNFRFRLLIFPGGTCEADEVSAFVEVDPLHTWDPLWAYHGVQYQITCIHHSDYTKNIALTDTFSFSKENIDRGWDMMERSNITHDSGWLGPDGSLRFRASVVVPKESDDANGPKIARVCRYCFGSENDEDDSNDFVEPCSCRGSGRAVHLRCLVAHFTVRGEWHNFACPTCAQLYEGEALLALGQISRERMSEEHGERSLQVAHSMCCMAQAHSQLGNTRENKELLESSLAIEQAHFGCGHVATSDTIVELASAYGKLGDVQQQKTLLEQALRVQEKHVGVGHISVAATLNNLATVHSELGDVRKERELLERSLKIKEDHFGKDRVECAATLVNLAGVYCELGDVDGSLGLLRKCLAIEEQHFGVGHVETAITLNNLALAHGETGSVAEMQRLLEKSLAIKARHFGADHLESSLTMGNLAMACAVRGSAAQARAFSDRARRSCEACCANSRRHGVVLLRAATVHAALGEILASEACATEALQVLGDALDSAAAARVVAQEKARTSRIWVAAGRADVSVWQDVTSAAERAASNGTKRTCLAAAKPCSAVKAAAKAGSACSPVKEKLARSWQRGGAEKLAPSHGTKAASGGYSSCEKTACAKANSCSSDK